MIIIWIWIKFKIIMIKGNNNNEIMIIFVDLFNSSSLLWIIQTSIIIIRVYVYVRYKRDSCIIISCNTIIPKLFWNFWNF